MLLEEAEDEESESEALLTAGATDLGFFWPRTKQNRVRIVVK